MATQGAQDDRRALRFRRPESNYRPLLRFAHVLGYPSGTDGMMMDLVRAIPELENAQLGRANAKLRRTSRRKK